MTTGAVMARKRTVEQVSDERSVEFATDHALFTIGRRHGRGDHAVGEMRRIRQREPRRVGSAHEIGSVWICRSESCSVVTRCRALAPLSVNKRPKSSTHFASSMRFPLRGAAFFLTVGVVQQTTPVALHLGQLPGGGTGSHLSLRILQQSHAGNLLRLVPAPFEVVVVVGVAEEAGVPLVVSVWPAGGDEVCDMVVGALSVLQLRHVESAWRTYDACLSSECAAAEPQQDFPRLQRESHSSLTHPRLAAPSPVPCTIVDGPKS